VKVVLEAVRVTSAVELTLHCAAVDPALNVTAKVESVAEFDELKLREQVPFAIAVTTTVRVPEVFKPVAVNVPVPAVETVSVAVNPV